MPHNVLSVLFAEIPPPNVLFSGGARNIKVIIKDAATGQGIPNIELELKSNKGGSPRTRITNSAGHADFQNTGTGIYTITPTMKSIEKAGYIYSFSASLADIKVSTGTSGMSHTISFKKAPPAPAHAPAPAPKPTATMTVTVIDSKTQKPIRGAMVNVGGFFPVYTNSNGKASIGGLTPTTPQSITISKSGYRTVSGGPWTPRSITLPIQAI